MDDRKGIIPIFVKLFVIAMLIAIIFFLFQIAPYFKPTETFEKGVIRLVVDDKDVTNTLPDKVYLEDDVVMMSRDTALKFFDNIYIYYEEKYDTAIITSDKMVGKIKLGENKININGEGKALKGTAKFSGDDLYIPMSSIYEVTDVFIDFNEKVVATTPRGMSRVKIVRAAKEHKLKAYKNDISMLNGFVESGEKLYFFDSEGKNDDDYLTVRNIRGDIGFVQFSKIVPSEIIWFNQGTEIQMKEAVDEIKYSLVWEYAENYSPDRTSEKRISAVDIISPTWVYIKNDKGDLKTTTDQKYYKWAKEQNYFVWPTLKNDFISKEELSTIMNDMLLREKLIKNVVDYALENKFDGINIDLEDMYKEDKDVFSQFVREISADLRRNKLVASIDVTIPGGSDTYSLCYDRRALADAVDYMMLMAYDQFGQWSEYAGPVASLAWVETYINEMLGYEGVDKDKLFLCVPFYSRYWKVDNETGRKISTKAIDMKTANSYLQKYKDVAVWDEIAGQYYIEYKADGATVKIWIENEDSLEKKIELINKYDLAGVAVWRWGFEEKNAWQVIDETMDLQ